MGPSRLAEIARRLIAGGMAPETEVAIVIEATLPGQQTIETTLGAARDGVHHGGAVSPGLAMIGAIVRLRRALLASLIPL